MTFIVVAAWWFLAMVHGASSNDRTVSAFGPYPSQELCRIAGEALTGDSRFWGPARVQAEKAAAAANAKQLATAIATAMKKPGYKPGDAIKVSPGYEVELDSAGK